jgi:hypothetical protein
MTKEQRTDCWDTVTRYGQRLARIEAAADQATDPRTKDNYNQAAQTMANHDQSFVFNAIFKLLAEAFPHRRNS